MTMEKIASPPAKERIWQFTLHALRVEKISLVRNLQENGFSDVDALNRLAAIGTQITTMKAFHEPYPVDSPEPTLEDVEARGLSWYWEAWTDVLDEDSEEEVDDE